jgi:triosephosphate isomerase
MSARRLITVTDVEAERERGSTALEVPAGAIVTPLARDAARRLGLALAPAREGRRAAVFGNWKANGTAASAVALAKAVLAGIAAAPAPARLAEAALFPPLPHLALVAPLLAGSPVALGAQDVSPFESGASTGAVPAEMLADLGVAYALVGHSERRRLFGETDEVVRAKLGRALAAGLAPVLCVGETLAEREAARTHAVLRGQLLSALERVAAPDAARVVVAYEPVWAIGTGLTPTAAEVEDALSALRDHLARRYGDEVARAARLLYGGSVSAANAPRFLALASCDGALVGGASLKAAEFLTMCGAPG